MASVYWLLLGQVISYITRERIYGLLDEQPNYKLLNRFFCTLKERNLPFWSSVSLAIFQFEWLTHKKLREPGSCQHDSLHCMVDSPCEPCSDLEGKFVNFKKSVWDTAVPKSLLPSSAIIASLTEEFSMLVICQPHGLKKILSSGQSWSVLHVTLQSWPHCFWATIGLWCYWHDDLCYQVVFFLIC